MRLRRIPEAIEKASYLDGPAGLAGDAVSKVIPAGPLKDALSGTWLGHALHPALTDLPIGFWTSAWVLDLVGGKQSQDAATKLIGLGVLRAVPTAVTGASDWSDTTGGERRTGLVHALSNSVALACYTVSYIERRRGHRTRGLAWGWAGATAASIGGYLGGRLIGGLGVGVDNTAFEAGPREWTYAGPALDLVDDEPRPFDVDGVTVVVVKQGERVAALSDRCTHRGGPLHEGDVDNGCIRCPWHGSTFRLEDGEVERGPATHPQPSYDAQMASGRVSVRRVTRA